VLLIAHPINWIDVTGVETFVRLRTKLCEQGITLHLAGLKLPVESLLRLAGELVTGDTGLCLYRTEVEALAAIATLPHTNVQRA
jgi:sulfate permease, SulP family